VNVGGAEWNVESRWDMPPHGGKNRENCSLVNVVVYLANVRYLLSPVHLSSVCLSYVTFVRPTRAVEIFGNISTALGTLAIH